MRVVKPRRKSIVRGLNGSGWGRRYPTGWVGTVVVVDPVVVVIINVRHIGRPCRRRRHRRRGRAGGGFPIRGLGWPRWWSVCKFDSKSRSGSEATRDDDFIQPSIWSGNLNSLTTVHSIRQGDLDIFWLLHGGGSDLRLCDSALLQDQCVTTTVVHEMCRGLAVLKL